MKTLRWAWFALTAGLLANGFYQAMYVAPTEATMGDIQRIFYYHFPSAMMAFLFFLISFIASIVSFESMAILPLSSTRKAPWVHSSQEAKPLASPSA